MSRLKPLVREEFKSKSPKYMRVFIGYNKRNKTYDIFGLRRDKGYYLEERITDNNYKLKEARATIWDYAEIQDGLPVK